VADRKLCVRQTLLRIDGQHGRFITILPRTRSEVGAFAADCLANRIRWAPLWRRRCPRHGGSLAAEASGKAAASAPAAPEAAAPKPAAATVLRNVLLEVFMPPSMRREAPSFNAEGVESGIWLPAEKNLKCDTVG
jgi:hypothetical protein